MVDAVLEGDFGIIAVALEVYADSVARAGGPAELQQRALELSTEFRNLEELLPPAVSETWNYEEHNAKLERYDDALGADQRWVTINEIVVPTERDRQQVLQAVRYLHDNKTIDTDFIAVNSLVHVYERPELVKVRA